MTEITEAERKALSLCSADNSAATIESYRTLHSFNTFVRFIQQVSDAAKAASELMSTHFATQRALEARDLLAPFILPEPVDPLTEVFSDMSWLVERRDMTAANLREALAKRGGRIVFGD